MVQEGVHHCVMLNNVMLNLIQYRFSIYAFRMICWILNRVQDDPVAFRRTKGCSGGLPRSFRLRSMPGMTERKRRDLKPSAPDPARISSRRTR